MEIRKRGLLCLGTLLENDQDLIRIEASVYKNSPTEEEYLQNILLASGNLSPTQFGFSHPIWDDEKRGTNSCSILEATNTLR